MASSSQRIVEIASAIRAGTTHPVDGVRQIVPLIHLCGLEDDEDAQVLITLEAETDCMPRGEFRKLWSAEVLRERDEEAAACVARVQGSLQAACTALIGKLTTP